MASRYYTDFSERKVSDPSGRPRAKKGTKGAEAAGTRLSDTPKGWPKPGPTWGNGFNRKTKTPVVKTSVVRHGGPY